MTVVHLSRLEDLAEEVPASGGRVVRVEVLDFNHRTKVPQITEHQLHILVRAKNGDGEILSVDLVENRAQIMKGDPASGEIWKTMFADANRRAQRIREWLEGLGFDVRSGTYDIGKDAQPIAATWDRDPERVEVETS